MDIATGETIRDRYTAEEHLDTGGFGSVWRGYDEELDRDVALKIPTFETNDRETVLERFEREQDLLGPFAEGLSHGTIVRYLDGNLEGEAPFIALEYLTGDPLVEKFGTGDLGNSVRRRIAMDLAETLDFLHRNDVVYLDLKPENVIIRESGQPVLLDFNTAVRPDDGTDMTFEADQFKAPELLADADVDAEVGPWTDVYSWGKLAFYLLTGAKVETEKVPETGLDPDHFGGDCSDEYAEVIRTATKPGVEDRYSDGMELAAAVADATHGSPRGLVTHVESGVSCAVANGDTLGRLAEDELVPWVVLADPEEHVSPLHGIFNVADGRWEFRDTSINGTYVATGDGSTYVLGEEGYVTQQQQGRIDPDDDQPSNTTPLSHGAKIAPVHPEYGTLLQFTALDR